MMLIAQFTRTRGRQPTPAEVLRLRQQATLQPRPDKQHHTLTDQTDRWRDRARPFVAGDTAAWVDEAAGFSGPQIDQAVTTVFTFVLGHALGAAAPANLRRKLARQNADPETVIQEHLERAREVITAFPRLQARLETPTADYAAGPEDSFDFGLNAILDGLATLREDDQVNETTAQPGKPVNYR